MRYRTDAASPESEYFSLVFAAASSYRLHVTTYRADGERTQEIETFSLVTKERNLKLSPELLEGAEGFSVMLESRDDLAEAPFRFAFLGASAGSRSGLIHLVE